MLDIDTKQLGLTELDLGQLDHVAGGTSHLKLVPVPVRPPRFEIPPQRPRPWPGVPEVPPPSCPSVPLL